MKDASSKLEALRIDRSALRRRRRWPWFALLLVVITAAASGVYTFGFADSGQPVRMAIAKATIAEPGSGPGSGSLLDATGYVVARRQASVSAKGIYKVVAVPVEEGQHVTEGQILARLDDTNTGAAVDQAKAGVKHGEAALVAARVAAADTRPIFDRSKRQLEAGLISTETFDAAKANYDAAQAAVSVAEQSLATSEAALEVAQRFEDDTIIRAPFDGVITNVSAQPGQLVSTQFAAGGGIATVVDMDSLEVQVDVGESFINRVAPGKPATITLNAYPDWRIPAEVIAIIPTADQAKATVKVRVAFKEKDGRVLPQMGASVSFLEGANRAADALSAAPETGTSVIIPIEAVQGSGDSGTVFVIAGDHVEKRSVKLGGRSPAGQTILSGLQSGDRVALVDSAKLIDGTKVRVDQ
ncbi:MAG TPA: efflux RND transporter periplasmic adaptor subunit [Micropepsaceae bacterium]|nr:efflux RND transporter periplasmic adaptor subunit [Micropepsaceae bacterium]